MIALYISLALLGLAAIDPVGIAIMPVLLVQKRPYMRSFIFLSGSFSSLMLMGIIFSKGLGSLLLRYEARNLWFVPTVEIVAGSILLLIAGMLFVRHKNGKISVEPTGKTLHWLHFSNPYLFLLGALLVAVQSILDVVFTVAMVRVGQYNVSNIGLLLAVATYSLTALVLQLLVVFAYLIAPPKQRIKRLTIVNILLKKYSYQTMICISLGLGILMLLLGLTN
jgi:hypothetical protein